MAEKNSAQTNRQTDRQINRQTDRHYENNGHLAVNQQKNPQKPKPKQTQKPQKQLTCVCVCLSFITNATWHNTAQNSSDNFPTYPPDYYHISDDVYLRGGTKSFLDNFMVPSKFRLKLALYHLSASPFSSNKGRTKLAFFLTPPY